MECYVTHFGGILYIKDVEFFLSNKREGMEYVTLSNNIWWILKKFIVHFKDA